MQEKVSVLDTTVNQLQDNLRLKEAEILSLHKELEDKSSQAQELAVKLGGLEERMAAVGRLGKLNCMMTVVTSPGFMRTVSFHPNSFASGEISGPL